MDIDSAASTPILQLRADLSNAEYLRFELTALAYHLQTPGFRALVIGPGGGRDLASALIFGAGAVDGVEINPIIANDVMRGQFREYSGGIYSNPRVHIAIDDGRSFVRRANERYDVIQASLVDTWAATAAGAYTLTENTLYTVDAFDDYLDHLADNGMGDKPKTSVVDRNCKVHHVPNLFVSDGAVFPTQSCYEPTLTIMAIAARAGEHIAESFRRGEL